MKPVQQSVRCNTKLRDLNIEVSVQDERAIEVVASGLPFHHGAQFAVDITLRSATTAGLPCTNAAHTNGAVLHRARMEKAAKYSEVVANLLLWALRLAADGAARRQTSWR